MFPALAVSTPPRELGVGRLQHRVAGAADLERVDRLQQSRASARSRRRCRHRAARAACARRRRRAPRARARISSSGDHSETTVPASSASARSRTCSAAARSSTAEPERLEHRHLVVRGTARHGCRSGSRRARRGCAPARSPLRASGRDSRPPRSGSTRGGRRRATQSTIVCVSSSRVVGMLEPTAFTCAPGFSHSRSTIGSGADVAVHDDVGVAHRLLGGRRLLDPVELERATRRAAPHDAPGRSHAPRASPRDASLRLDAGAEDRERAARPRARAAASRRRRRRPCAPR